MTDRLKGKRYFGLVRCSLGRQAETSIPDQLGLLDNWGAERGMTKVGEKVLDGVRGTVPALRKDIPELLECAKRKEFDVLLVQDLWRLTRCGTRHGFLIEFQFAQHGVEVISASDDIPDGPAGEFYRTFKYQAGLEHVRKLSHDSTRSQLPPIIAGEAPHCQKAPYGVDRLYLGKDGKPRYRIRNLPDGRQLKLQPDREEIIEEFEPNGDDDQKRHYIKQPNEHAVLVKGDRSDVELVRHMFKRRYVDRWGTTRIARELNGLGVVTPQGKPHWGTGTLNSLLLNPVYVGLGIANRTSRALFYRRSAKQPVAANVDLATLFERSAPPTLYRPREDWIIVKHPDLEDFLDTDLRETVRKYQFNVLERRALGPQQRANPVRDRHIDSPFFLKKILHSRQGHHPMSGSVSRPREKLYRYYVVTNGGQPHRQGEGLNRQIPAEPLEEAVLAKLKEVLLDTEGLRQRIVGAVLLKVKHAADAAHRHEELLKEKAAVEGEVNFILSRLGKLARDAVAERTDQLERRLESLQRQIEDTEPENQPNIEDAEEIADSVIEEIRGLEKGIDERCYVSIRRLLELLVADMTVDLETKKLSLEFRLPSWAIAKDVRLDHALACRTSNEANAKHDLLLGFYGCTYRKKRNDRCFNCTRSARAAA